VRSGVRPPYFPFPPYFPRATGNEVDLPAMQQSIREKLKEVQSAIYDRGDNHWTASRLLMHYLCPTTHNLGVPFVERTENQPLAADADSGEDSILLESGQNREYSSFYKSLSIDWFDRCYFDFNASCTTNSITSLHLVLNESFGVKCDQMTTIPSYAGDHMILAGWRRDRRRARAGAYDIVPTSTGTAEAVAAALPKYSVKLNGMILRVSTPNGSSIVALVVKVRPICIALWVPVPNVPIVNQVVKAIPTCNKEDIHAVVRAAADGPMKGISYHEGQPLISSDFMQTYFPNSVDAAPIKVMGEKSMLRRQWQFQ